MGRGKYTYASGGTYEGKWETGVQQGRGKFIVPHLNDPECIKVIYDGHFKDGVYSGWGRYTVMGGYIFEG